MQNDQRSQPFSSLTSWGHDPALPTSDPQDADVVQAALRLHLKHFHTLESAHTEAEQVFTDADPSQLPAATERAATHRVRRDELGRRREFLEQLAGFPTSALNTLSGTDVEALRLPTRTDTGAQQTSRPPHPESPKSPHGKTSVSEASPDPHTKAKGAPAASPALEQEPLYPEDAPGYAEEISAAEFLDETSVLDGDLGYLFGGFADIETWELVPASPQPEATREHEEHASGREEKPEAAGTSYLPEDRPDFRDLVHGHAEVPETSPKKKRRWTGLRRKRQRER